MSAEVPRLFVFARHAESTANTAHALSSDPARPVALTERGRTQAKGPDDASRRYANALRSLLARTEAAP
jgi:broad specificity phosphatase PhoE